MIKLGRNPANNPFIEPYGAVRTPAGGDVDLAARRIVRQRFSQARGFKSDPYVDDPAAQAFNSPGGVSGLGMYIVGGAHKLSYFAKAKRVASGIAGLGYTAADCASGCLIGDAPGVCAPASYCQKTGPNYGIFDTIKNFFTGPGNGGGQGTAQSALAQRCPQGHHYDFTIGGCAEDSSTDAPSAYSFSYAPGAGLSKFASSVAAPMKAMGAGSDTLATVGMLVGGAGVVYGLAKGNKSIALGAAAIGVAALVLPKLMSGASPLAGAAVRFLPSGTNDDSI